MPRRDVQAWTNRRDVQARANPRTATQRAQPPQPTSASRPRESPAKRTGERGTIAPHPRNRRGATYHAKPTLRQETLQLHAGQTPDTDTPAQGAVPIYQTTSYCYKSAQAAADVFCGAADGYTYTRIENPTVDVLEQRVRAGGRRCVRSLCKRHGGHHRRGVRAVQRGRPHRRHQHPVRRHGHAAGGRACRSWRGHHHHVCQPRRSDHMESAIRPNTKMLYLETICNPNINVPDFDGIKAIAVRHGLPVVLDNTFRMPPIFQAKRHKVRISSSTA